MSTPIIPDECVSSRNIPQKKEYPFHIDLGIEFLFHFAVRCDWLFASRKERPPVLAQSASESKREPDCGPANLANKIAVVTGGAQGLGEAIARLFAERGVAGLLIGGRNAENGERVAREISSAGCPTVFVKANLAKVADCRNLIAEADRRFGRVDALVNAAALADRGNIFDDRRTLQWDFRRRCARAVLPHSGGRAYHASGEDAGTTVNIQSMSAHGGQSFIAAYSASKGALSALTRNVAHALVKSIFASTASTSAGFRRPAKTAS
jgi:NADP-dependent 3-hydroxy acid dehydrogenase YdfG